MNTNDYFKIGYISKTHGLKGEVSAIFENEIDVHSMESIFIELDGNLVPFFITQISDRGDKAFVKFENIDTLDQATSLKGRSIFAPKKNRPKLNRGQFYDDEVIGFQVEDEMLGNLGVVTEIQGSGMNKLLTILTENKEVLVPIHSPFIKIVNKSLKKIKLSLPESYLEI